MAAYAIADVRIRDQSLVGKYRELSQSSIAKYGGRYIVRGGPVQTMEGDWSPQIFVIVEFPTMERLREWYGSPEYAEALKIRASAMDRDLICIEGVPS
jgi:uncharacterized protein (DUF1330 family)